MKIEQTPVVIRLIIKGNEAAAKQAIADQVLPALMEWFHESKEAPFNVGDLLYYRTEVKPTPAKVEPTPFDDIAWWKEKLYWWLQGQQTDSFCDRLIKALFKADGDNRARLCQGFPGLAEAFEEYMTTGFKDYDPLKQRAATSG